MPTTVGILTFMSIINFMPIHLSSESEKTICNLRARHIAFSICFIKVSNEEDEFRITLDISSYSPEEITVKTKHNRIVVHAKHEERPDEFGLIERELKRQYILPKVSMNAHVHLLY